MDVNEILDAIGGQTHVPHQPEGPSEVQPLNPLGLDRVGGEPFPANVNAQQGAGAGSGGLTPGAQGSPTAGDGTVEPGNDDNYSGQGGPVLLEPSQGIAALAPDPAHGRPAGSAPPAGEVVGRPDHALGRDQSLGQGINPMLKPANAPKQDGPFGKPSQL
jgi:hypothetical protein